MKLSFYQAPGSLLPLGVLGRFLQAPFTAYMAL